MTDRDRSVWITGLGLVTPVGIGLDAFWDGLRAGRSPIRRIDRFDPSGFRSQIAAQVDDFEPTDYMDAKTARQTDRFSHLALAAGNLALTDAGISPGARGAPRQDRFGVYIGSALGGIAYAEMQHERYIERGIRAVAPNLALAVFGGAAPANIGISLGDGRCRPGRRRRGAAQPARLRRVRHHPGVERRPQRRPDGRGTAVRLDARRVRHGRGRRAADA